MSREAIEVVQALGDAYFRGDEEAMLELVDPDVVVTQFPDQPDAQPYLGHQGMLQAMSAWVETWDDYAIEAVEAKDFGDNILVALRQRGRGKASGVELEANVYFVYTVRGGKVVRWQMFPDEGEAIRAAESQAQR
jgi:ketosteroid isomerase-like protein